MGGKDRVGEWAIAALAPCSGIAGGAVCHVHGIGAFWVAGLHSHRRWIGRDLHAGYRHAGCIAHHAGDGPCVQGGLCVAGVRRPALSVLGAVDGPRAKAVGVTRRAKETGRCGEGRGLPIGPAPAGRILHLHIITLDARTAYVGSTPHHQAATVRIGRQGADHSARGHCLDEGYCVIVDRPRLDVPGLIAGPAPKVVGVAADAGIGCRRGHGPVLQIGPGARQSIAHLHLVALQARWTAVGARPMTR